MRIYSRDDAGELVKNSLDFVTVFVTVYFMKMWVKMSVSIVAFGSLVSCASLSVDLPKLSRGAIEAEQLLQSGTALTLYLKHNDRLQEIGRKVLVANAPLCARAREDLGVQAVQLKDIPQPLRDIAHEQMGLDERPQLIHMAQNVEGLMLGDRLMRGNHVIKGDDIGAGQSELTILRGKANLTLPRPELTRICDYRLKLAYSPAINAMATGRSIVVTSGMMDFANDDELAMIIGHELAHNNLSHIRKIIQNRILLFGLANATRQFECEADYAGLYYMARAGFNIDVAAPFWRRYAQLSISSLTEAKSHPITAERFARLSVAIDEINQKVVMGAPLEPNAK